MTGKLSYQLRLIADHAADRAGQKRQDESGNDLHIPKPPIPALITACYSSHAIDKTAQSKTEALARFSLPPVCAASRHNTVNTERGVDWMDARFIAPYLPRPRCHVSVSNDVTQTASWAWEPSTSYDVVLDWKMCSRVFSELASNAIVLR